jgi:hypothetical protein
MSVLHTMGPWPCPTCGAMVYSHQVHQCHPVAPWEVNPDLPWRYVPRPVTDTKTVATMPKPKPKPKPPGEAMRPEDV